MALKRDKKTGRKLANAEEYREEYPGIKYPDGLTKEMAHSICSFIKKGGSPRAACVAVGISLAKFERWYYRGQLMSQKVDGEITTTEMLPDEDMICHAFYTMVSRAIAKAAVFCASNLRRSADWRAHAWRMDRMYSKFLEPDAPASKPLGEDGKPIESGTKVVIYMPDNGRSTR